MRPLEILLAVLLLPLLLWLIQGNRTRFKGLIWLPLIAGIVLPLQLALEGYRWQMLPLYSLTVLAILASAWLLLHHGPESRRWGCLSVFLIFLSLVFWLLAVALPVLLPVPSLPEPSGPFPVGTLSQELVDPIRKELYSGNPDEPRKIMIQVWYPAGSTAGGARALWVEHPDIFAPRLAGWLGLRSFSLDHLNLAYTWAFTQVPLASPLSSPGSFPVLLFSHGWEGLASQNTFQSEELASYGYVVVAISHTYGAVATVFPDGQVALVNSQALPVNASPVQLKAAGNRLVDQWAGDLALALDFLDQLNQNDPQGRFTGSLDLDRVGVFGHSTGGGAAIEFCGRDDRCRAGFVMDPYMLPVSDHLLETGVSQPFFFMFSQAWPSAANNQRFFQLYDRMQDHSQVTMIMGTNHHDFTDIPYFSPFAYWLGLKGPLTAERVAAILKAYSLAFFSTALDYPAGMSENPPPVDNPSPAFNEVIFDWSP